MHHDARRYAPELSSWSPALLSRVHLHRTKQLSKAPGPRGGVPGNDGIISVTAHASAVQKTQWAPIRWSHSFTPSYSSMMCFANGRAGSVHVGGSAGGLGPARHAVAWGGANCAAYQRHSAGQHQLLPFVRTLCPRPAQPPPLLFCTRRPAPLALPPLRCAERAKATAQIHSRSGNRYPGDGMRYL